MTTSADSLEQGIVDTVMRGGVQIRMLQLLEPYSM